MGAQKGIEREFIPDQKLDWTTKIYDNVESFTVKFADGKGEEGVHPYSPQSFAVSITKPGQAGTYHDDKAMTYEPGANWYDAGYSPPYSLLAVALIVGALVGFLVARWRHA